MRLCALDVQAGPCSDSTNACCCVCCGGCGVCWSKHQASLGSPVVGRSIALRQPSLQSACAAVLCRKAQSFEAVEARVAAGQQLPQQEVQPEQQEVQPELQPEQQPAELPQQKLQPEQQLSQQEVQPEQEQPAQLSQQDLQPELPQQELQPEAAVVQFRFHCVTKPGEDGEERQLLWLHVYLSRACIHAHTKQRHNDTQQQRHCTSMERACVMDGEVVAPGAFKAE